LDIPPIKEMQIIDGQVSQLPSSGISREIPEEGI
ncbi:MAG: hypothetical protein RLZ90_412, partial [Pseudomonadota bacterium]